MYYVKNVRFKMPNTGEEIFFNDGDVDGFYDIINWQVNNNGEISYVTVGNYNGSAAPENRMTIVNDSIVWNNDMLEVSGISIKKKLAYAPFRLWFGSSFISVAMCESLLGQCAVRTVSRAPGRGFDRESRSAALTAFPVLTERSATQLVSKQQDHIS